MARSPDRLRARPPQHAATARAGGSGSKTFGRHGPRPSPIRRRRTCGRHLSSARATFIRPLRYDRQWTGLPTRALATSLRATTRATGLGRYVFWRHGRLEFWAETRIKHLIGIECRKRSGSRRSPAPHQWRMRAICGRPPTSPNGLDWDIPVRVEPITPMT